MRIGVSALLLTSEGGYRKAGISRYIHRVVDRMLAMEAGHEYILFVPHDTELPVHWTARPELTVAPVEFPGRIQRIQWEHWAPKRIAPAMGLDVWFSTAQMVPFPCGRPRAGMLHDLIPIFYPRHFTWEKALYQKMALRYAIRRAELIFANSETTKQDILEYLPLPGLAERIVVTPLGPGNELVPADCGPDSRATLARLGVEFGRYFFALGTLEPRKNLPALFEAMAILARDGRYADVGLVVGGGKGWKEGPIGERLSQLGLGDRVRFLGYVEDEDLPALFACSEAFVFPSLYEGFGMPVLEAMIVGAPVLAARRPAMQEVGGEAAEYFDPEDPDDIAAALARRLDDSQGRATRIEAGFQRAKIFSWDDCAARTLAALERLAGP